MNQSFSSHRAYLNSVLLNRAQLHFMVVGDCVVYLFMFNGCSGISRLPEASENPRELMQVDFETIYLTI